MFDRRYSVLLFDMDDTLTATHNGFENAYRNLSARDPETFRPDCEEEKKDLRRLIYHYTFLEAWKKQEFYPVFCKKWGLRNPPATLAEFEVPFREEHIRNISLFPWTVPVLEALRQKGVRMAMVTNGWSWVQRKKLEKTGISHFFEEIAIAEEVGVSKPDPRIFLQTAERLGVAPGDCLFVGNDPTTDIAGARASGIDSLWITEETENTAGATYLSSDIRCLVDEFS